MTTLHHREHRREFGIEVFWVDEGYPVKVDALVVEQDTSRVLGPVESISDPQASVAALVDEMKSAREPLPGSVLVERTRPIRLHAIIHDLNRTPTWRIAWVSKALHRIAREVKSRRISALSIPMLAVQHGTMEPERFSWLLRGFQRQVAGRLDRLFVLVPRGGGHTLTNSRN